MIPLHRLGIILVNATAKAVTTPKTVLRNRVPLFGGFAEPLYRFLVIASNTIAMIIATAKFVLRKSITLFRHLAIDGYCVLVLNIIFGLHYLMSSPLMHHAINPFQHRLCILVFSRFFTPTPCFYEILWRSKSLFVAFA